MPTVDWCERVADDSYFGRNSKDARSVNLDLLKVSVGEKISSAFNSALFFVRKRDQRLPRLYLLPFLVICKLDFDTSEIVSVRRHRWPVPSEFVASAIAGRFSHP